MKMSFEKKTGEEVIDAEVTKAIVPHQPRTVAAVLPQADDFAGEWLRKDVRLPRINLVQKISDNELIKNFGLGSFVLAREVKLCEEGTALVVTALQAAKDMIQKVKYDSGDQATVYQTEQEVIDNGGSLNYKDVESGNFFQPRAHIEFAIGAPEGISDTDAALFPYDFNGTPYALALYTVASSAYTSLAKELATMRSANKVIRKGLRFGSLKMTAETRKKNTKSWFVPVARFNGENSAELVEFFYSIEPSLKR